MTGLEDYPAYRAGSIDGAASRQAEVDRANHDADRYYRAALDDDRRVIDSTLTTLERKQLAHRATTAVTPVSPAEALASWGLEDPPDPAPVSPAESTVPATPRPVSSSRRRAMRTRTITGNLAADPEAVQAGQTQIVKLRVIENTGEYRRGVWPPHEEATTHHVEAKFELGENMLASLHKGDAVIVVGYERTASGERDGAKRFGRILDADAIGPNLARATATVARTPRTDA